MADDTGWRSSLPSRGLALQAVAGGVMAATGHPPFSALPLALVGLALMLRAMLLADTSTAGVTGWLAGCAYFAVSLNWIVQPFFVDPWRHAWMSPFAIVFLSGGLALFWGVAAGFAAWAGDGPVRRPVALIVALSAVELARSYLMTGFPWALIGHLWIGWPGMQLAAWVGPIGLTLLALIPAALAAGLGPRGVAAGLAVALAVTGCGAWLASGPVPPGSHVVRLVQPAVAQALKWDRDTASATFDRLLRLTAEAPDPGKPKPDLTIWPETAFPYLYDGPGPLLTEIATVAGGKPVLVGAIRIDGYLAYNSLFVLGADGLPGQIYDKHHLVPFGEYLPFDTFLTWIGLSAFTAQEGHGYSAGPGPRLLDFGPLGHALPLICYEAIFPQDISDAPSRPDWLVQVTNDAWFGTFSGPYQHLAQARLRAVEQGLPMIRVANTGISAVIDARGRVLAELPLGVAGRVDAVLPAALPVTPYATMGDLPAALLLGLGVVALALTRRGKSS